MFVSTVYPVAYRGDFMDGGGLASTYPYKPLFYLSWKQNKLFVSSY